jgi:acetylornithine deacetylase/succinyl-diaminopimelate desuccinylase-like protein
VALTLTVRVLDEGVHSGDASGIVPSSMRIARMLLDRVESSLTGEVLVPELHCETPSEVVDAARATAAAMPEPAASHFAWSGSTRAMTADGADQLLARTWRPTLSVIGVDGFPPFDRAGNVLRPFTSLKLSFRTPPVVDTLEALAALTARLTEDPPYGATVTIDEVEHSDGWACPAPAPWLAEALHEASLLAFGAPAAAFGEGGSIPFIGMLARRFPAAQFVITGVLGPGSNAHGPNEFLHLPMARGLTVAMASVLGVHAAQR